MQTLLSAVHAVAELFTASAGQVPLLPVQFSARSHSFVAARQIVALDWKTSTHAALVPVQWSAALLSQVPPCEAPVQRVALDLKASAGHVAELPVHVSATSQALAAARHVVPALPFVKTQPDAGLHVSTVQTFESLQVIGVPTQLPPVQTSPDVQALPSSHAVPFGRPEHGARKGNTVSERIVSAPTTMPYLVTLTRPLLTGGANTTS